jgi:hypothetical protein
VQPRNVAKAARRALGSGRFACDEPTGGTGGRTVTKRRGWRALLLLVLLVGTAITVAATTGRTGSRSAAGVGLAANFSKQASNGSGAAWAASPPRSPAPAALAHPSTAPPRPPTATAPVPERTGSSTVAVAPSQPSTPTTRPVPAAAASTTSESGSCAASIAAVTARGLYPAPGFVVICPGNALGHLGMTCYNIPGVCAGQKQIVIHDPEPFVVANEFENSRIFSGDPGRCRTLDCGHAAYGF